MESSQRKQRDDLDQAFSESLDQLEEILESEDSQPTESKPEPTPKRRKAASIDLAALEDAAADIEAYMQNQKGSS
jgi:hypothetical protein